MLLTSCARSSASSTVRARVLSCYFFRGLSFGLTLDTAVFRVDFDPGRCVNALVGHHGRMAHATAPARALTVKFTGTLENRTCGVKLFMWGLTRRWEARVALNDDQYVYAYISPSNTRPAVSVGSRGVDILSYRINVPVPGEEGWPLTEQPVRLCVRTRFKAGRDSVIKCWFEWQGMFGSAAWARAKWNAACPLDWEFQSTVVRTGSAPTGLMMDVDAPPAPWA